MRLYLAILVGKLIALITRTFKIGGGSAAPGLYALKIEPELVTKLARKIPKNVVITGTNGKTTTARILSHLAEESGLQVIRNSTGSNLERGIASALIHKSLFINHKSFDLGIWELDEFAFNNLVPKIKPDLILFLNVSRDQLDRYGEVDQVVTRWSQTLSKIDPKTIVLIDPSLSELKKSFKVKKITEPKNIKTNGLGGSEFELKGLKINIPVPGLYNIQNCVAALEAADYLGLPTNQLTNSLTNFQPAFGRVEKLPFGYIFLIKNPAGATQVFETIAPQIKKDDRLLIALNDNFADGTDVSWIWDAEFERLFTVHCSLFTVCSGTRAYDMSVRLKYAGFEANQIKVEPDLRNALKEARMGLKGQLFILPTYTALLELQGILTKQGVKSRYWEEK